MGFLTKEGLQNLTNKLVQGDAIKVASHRGKNVKEVIDNIQRECENVATPNTMTLENRVNEFKIGQGRDVDVSGDVEEGKVEVELQGKTYQNLVKENQIYVKELKTTNHTGVLLPKYDLKSNTIYTIMFTVSNLVKDGNSKVYSIFRGNDNDNSFIQFDALYVEKNGLFAQKFTLANGLKNFLIGVSGSSNKNNPSFTIGDIMILEGDYTQTPIEELPKYFEGIKSSFEDGVVDVEVEGKNLLNINNIVYNKWIDSANGLLTGDSNTRHYMDYTKIEGGRTIIFCGCTPTACYVYSDIGVCIGERSWQNSFSKPQKLPIEAKYIRFTFDSTVAFENMQLEYSTNPTTYEPYYKKKISFNIGEPLRSLPNGVCDEIRNNNGQWELVRKTAKVIFDGSEIWSKDTHNTGCVNTSRFFSIIRGSKVLLNPICNYPVLNMTTYSIDKENIQIASDGNIYIRILNYKLPTLDVEGFKKWLQANPTTVVYELATPTITPIEPIEFDVKPLATMTINSDIAPISNHKVILNRAGQIEQGIELIANLKNRVNTLENIYDSNLIATQYKLDNLKLNYELEREED